MVLGTRYSAVIAIRRSSLVQFMSWTMVDLPTMYNPQSHPRWHPPDTETARGRANELTRRSDDQKSKMLQRATGCRRNSFRFIDLNTATLESIRRETSNHYNYSNRRIVVRSITFDRYAYNDEHVAPLAAEIRTVRESKRHLVSSGRNV